MNIPGLVVVSGPPGPRKTALINKLLEENSKTLRLPATHCTARRDYIDLRPGASHRFVSRAEFMKLAGQDAFVEWTESYGDLYGTTLEAIHEASENPKVRCIVDVNSEGVKKIKAKYAHLAPLYIFIAPAPLEDLSSQLERRGRSPPLDELTPWTDAAAKELAYAASGAFDIIIVNDSIDRAYTQLVDVLKIDTRRRGGHPEIPQYINEKQWAVGDGFDDISCALLW